MPNSELELELWLDNLTQEEFEKLYEKVIFYKARRLQQFTIEDPSCRCGAISSFTPYHYLAVDPSSQIYQCTKCHRLARLV